MKLNVFVIKKHMARNQLTGTMLAKLAGISRQSLSDILSKGSCSTVNVGRIASALGVPVDEIVKED